MEKINNFDEFKIAVKDFITAKLPECSVELIDVPKNNGICLSGITVRKKNTNVSPTIYLEPHYDQVQSGKSFADVMSEVMGNVKEGMKGAKNVNINAISDFELAKNRICYRLINKLANAELLKTMPHKDFYDLAIVYYIMFDSTNGSVSSIKITNSMIRHWGIDEQQLYSLACKNTPILHRGKIVPMNGVMENIAGKTATASQDVERITADGFDIVLDRRSEMTVYIATNTNNLNGAAVILYNGFLETLAQKLGSFFFIPSSIHEYLIIPKGFVNRREILQMVREVNETAVSAEDILSNNIFYYDASNNDLQMIS